MTNSKLEPAYRTINIKYAIRDIVATAEEVAKTGKNTNLNHIPLLVLITMKMVISVKEHSQNDNVPTTDLYCPNTL